MYVLDYDSKISHTPSVLKLTVIVLVSQLNHLSCCSST